MSENGKIAQKWWYLLSNGKTGDRGVLARLRRCEKSADALTILQAIKLSRDLGCDALELAILLAHVKEDDAQRPMRAAGWKSFPGEKKETEAGADRPVLSELRFRRLLKTPRDERLDAFKRLVRILGGKVNVAALTDDFLFWGDKVRERWAFDYFAAGIAQPTNDLDKEATA